MKKQFPILMLFFLGIFFGLAEKVEADTHIVLYPYGTTQVSDAIAAASDGDVVEIPAGINVTWASTITIDKALTLRGAEGVQPIINRNMAPSNNLINIAPSADVAIRVTNLIFKNCTSPGRNCADYTRDIYIAGNAVGLTKIRIDHNTFINGVEAMFIVSNAYPLIDHNLFTDVAFPMRSSDGQVNANGVMPWDRSITPGTSTAIFIEDNTFNISNYYTNDSRNCYQDSDGAIFYSNEGSRLVIRHNIVNSQCSYGGISPVDFHGNYGGDWHGNPIRSVILSEIYDNTFNMPMFGSMDIRGGSHLIFNNTVTCTSCGNGWARWREEEGYNANYSGVKRTAWPAWDQVNNSFIWGNTKNGIAWNAVTIASRNSNCTEAYNPTNGQEECCAGYHTGSCEDLFIQPNRDYFLHGPQASGGREIYPNLQGDNDMTFSASGPNAYYNPNANPEIGYIPYTYPHPLQGIVLTCLTPGDFTCNGYSISDLQTMISIILGTDSTTSRTQADMNNDTQVNISDLQLLINKVLGIN